MMELNELYESDLSLFARDILLGLNSPADVKTAGLGQDGFFTTVAQEKPVSSNQIALIPHSIGQSEHGLEDQFDTSWLDATVDLLGFLGEEMVDPVQTQSEDDNVVSLAPLADVITVNNAQTDNPGCAALDVLQSLAEETDRQIKETKKEADIRRGSDHISHPDPNQGSGEKGLLELLTEGLMNDLDENVGLLDVSVDDVVLPDMMPTSPILSPVSVDDIESLLSDSSRPTSPGNCSFYAESITSDAASDSDPDYYPEDMHVSVSPTSSKHSKRPQQYSPRSAPYTKSKSPRIVDRKERKKQQNREAALRYREKKRAEGNGFDSECDKLEKRNKYLNDTVDEMTREIQYLKDLMSDVFEAKKLK